MGISPAPPWATLFYALHEESFVPRWSKQNLLFYKRFIDDVFVIWLRDPNPSHDGIFWHQFTTEMHQWHGLKWTCETPKSTVNFMDLTITILEGRLKTTLYEKPQNLYLYLPPHSSHPKGVLSGLVFRQVLCARRLRTLQQDADNKIKEFFQRLLNRGHQIASLIPLFKRAKENAFPYISQMAKECVHRKNQKALESRASVYFHLQYHAEDPPAREIQKIWSDFVAQPPGDTPLYPK